MLLQNTFMFSRQGRYWKIANHRFLLAQTGIQMGFSNTFFYVYSLRQTFYFKYWLVLGKLYYYILCLYLNRPRYLKYLIRVRFAPSMLKQRNGEIGLVYVITKFFHLFFINWWINQQIIWNAVSSKSYKFV